MLRIDSNYLNQRVNPWFQTNWLPKYFKLLFSLFRNLDTLLAAYSSS